MNPNATHRHLVTGVWIHSFFYVLVNVIEVIVWFVYTPEQHFWPIWSIVGWGVGLAFHIRAVLQSASSASP